MFFAMANALLDASISAWETKRFYDYVRPITAIHSSSREAKSAPGRDLTKGPN
jgi:hypothetical protein